jgi:hypothetical protein
MPPHTATVAAADATTTTATTATATTTTANPPAFISSLSSFLHFSTSFIHHFWQLSRSSLA